MAGIFPPPNQGGVPPSAADCAYTPTNTVIGEGPFYIAPDCTTVLTACQINSITSEIFAAVDCLGFAYNADRVDNLCQALRQLFADAQECCDSKVNRSGDTMEGPLHVVCPPTLPTEAVCKDYVDDLFSHTGDCCNEVRQELADAIAATQDLINNRVRRDGDTMTGPLILSDDAITAPHQATTKEYVDGEINHYYGGIIVQPEPPPVAPASRLWWNTTDGRLYLHYDDGNSIQWVQVNGDPYLIPPWAENYLPLAGGTLTGALHLPTTPNPTPSEAINRQFADNSYLRDAPVDGHTYGRRDGAWVPVCEEAPLVGGPYLRMNGEWFPLAAFIPP